LNRTGLRGLLDSLKLSDTNAVYFLEQKSKWETIFSPETNKKIIQIKPSAFFVFNNQPFILFFDLTLNTDINKEEQIHKQVWSFDQSPLVFIIKNTDIEIFNAFAYDKKINRLEKVKLNDGERLTDLFSFWNLQSGTTWTWLQENHYKKSILDKRVNQKLFENIKFVRETLTNKNFEDFLEEDEANILILRLIFIRYLIDRGVKLEETFISGSTPIERKKSFIELVEKPRKLNEFFEWLNGKFNGVLFKDVKVQLSKNVAKKLALVFNGEIPEGLFEGGDLYFEIFDFSIIPVELISGIYEALIDEEARKLHSAVYTPSFLVEYILTNTIDRFFQDKKNKKIAECRIFDPSVGSGIFLVQSFRRMVDREIALSGGNKISKNRLREIAQNNLFGIDINEQALKVTCFSIYVAMLDYIDPKSILPVFHFPNLIGNNLFAANFFDTKNNFNTVIYENEVDFILGNPPWKSDKDEVHINWLKENNKTVGRFEIAQSFLLRSKDFMKPETVSALIVTSTIFYNISTPTKKFKQEFLRQFCINRFFDLSAVRRLIFEEKNSPCAIVFYKLSKGEDYLTNVVRHLSVKSNLFLKYYKMLVIEKFDQKEIQQKNFIENDWMFKVALYGNTLDFSLLRKFRDYDSIIKLYDNKINKRDGLKRDVLAKHKITNIDDFIIEKENIFQYFTPSKKSSGNPPNTVNNIFQLFGKYKIVIKGQTKNESEIIISYNEGDAIFRNDTFIIDSDKETIYLLYSFLISKLYTHFQFLTSSTWGIATRPAIRLEEYINFPIAEPDYETKEKLKELTNQFLKPYKEFHEKFSLGEPHVDYKIFREMNSIMEKLYNIKEYEKDIINYVLDISRYQFQESKQQKIIRTVNTDNEVLEKYADVFIEEFKGIYADEYLQIQVFPLQHFIAMNFVFSEEKPRKRVVINEEITNESEVFKLIANNISISKIAKDLYIQKDIKGFEENSFYIIKPNEYKCWHRAMAWYDVAEIKKTIEEAEINYLKNSLNA
jgi:hypothetical protein